MFRREGLPHSSKQGVMPRSKACRGVGSPMTPRVTLVLEHSAVQIFNHQRGKPRGLLLWPERCVAPFWSSFTKEESLGVHFRGCKGWAPFNHRRGKLCLLGIAGPWSSPRAGARVTSTAEAEARYSVRESHGVTVGRASRGAGPREARSLAKRGASRSDGRPTG